MKRESPPPNYGAGREAGFTGGRAEVCILGGGATSGQEGTAGWPKPRTWGLPRGGNAAQTSRTGSPHLAAP